MRNNQLSLENYFDDGVVQYWRPVSSEPFYEEYRLTVEPTWISIDALGWSWNDRRCWKTVYPNIGTMDEAIAILCNLLCLPTFLLHRKLVKEETYTQREIIKGQSVAFPRMYIAEREVRFVVSETNIGYVA